MGTKVCIGGVVFDETDARVSVFDRGFLYGDSVFEVMRTYGGVPFALGEHLDRLERSCERVLIAAPVSRATLASEIAATLAAADNEESYVRIIVTRGSGPVIYDPTTARDPQRVIIVLPLTPQPAEMYRDGVAVALVRCARPTEGSPAAGAKASNYLVNLLAVHQARQRGAYEAILQGPGGEVLEGSTSNVFLVREGAVRTPRIEAGILEGITRATVIGVAHDEGITLEETALFPHDLYEADEVFITSSLREVVPVVRVDDRPVADGRPGPITRRLADAYRRAVLARTARGSTD